MSGLLDNVLTDTYDIEQELIQSCTIQTATTTTDSTTGAVIDSWADEFTDVDCLVDETGGNELQFGKEVVIADAKIFLKKTQSITEQRRIVQGGNTWSVLLVKNPSGQNHHKEAFLQRVKV